jgi:quercetin dioxygenase-like cupin family protein
MYSKRRVGSRLFKNVPTYNVEWARAYRERKSSARAKRSLASLEGSTVMNERTGFSYGCVATSTLLALSPLLSLGAPPGASDEAATVTQLMQRDLASSTTQEALVLTVAYRPGGASLPHRHDAQVFVYVLEGEMTMQVDGHAAVTLRPGQTFYEGPGDIHRVSANASKTAPAKILVFMIKDKNKPASRAVTEERSP